MVGVLRALMVGGIDTRRARAVMLAACGLLVAATLAGCGLFGGKAPPAKTYIMVPQQGTVATHAPANP